MHLTICCQLLNHGIDEDGHVIKTNVYPLSMKDMCTISSIGQLIEKGVDYKTAVMTLRIGLAGYDLYEISEMNQEAMVTVKWNDNAIGDYYDSFHKLVIGISSDDNNLGDFIVNIGKDFTWNSTGEYMC